MDTPVLSTLRAFELIALLESLELEGPVAPVVDLALWAARRQPR